MMMEFRAGAGHDEWLLRLMFHGFSMLIATMISGFNFQRSSLAFLGSIHYLQMLHGIDLPADLLENRN